jgi:hypothetical protein
MKFGQFKTTAPIITGPVVVGKLIGSGDVRERAIRATRALDVY